VKSHAEQVQVLFISCWSPLKKGDFNAPRAGRPQRRMLTESGCCEVFAVGGDAWSSTAVGGRRGGGNGDDATFGGGDLSRSH